MARQSFSDAILQEPARFVKYAFDKNPNIKDFGDFDSAFREAFDSPLGNNAKIDSEDMIVLFESSECKSRMKDNVSAKEYDSLYGDGNEVDRYVVSKKKIETFTIQKTQKSRTIKGKSYMRTKPKLFTPAEMKFIKVRKQKGISKSEIIREYNLHYKDKPRTKSSIGTKYYRI